jgi:tRNA 2-thiouridine synthesizing protein A
MIDKNQMIEFNVDVDASGLHCPLPLLRLKKALKDMQSGEIVRVIATDPAAHLDFGVYAEQTSNKIIEYFKDEEGKQVFYICKK